MNKLNDDASGPVHSAGRSQMKRVSTVPTTPISVPRRRRAIHRARRSETVAAYLFLSVPLLLFLIFIVLPLLATVGLSFFSWDMFTPPRFVGLLNYQQVIHDPAVAAAFVNTFVFTVVTLIIHIVLAVLLALAVSRAMPRLLRYFLRSAFFFPLLVSSAASALIWLYMLDPSFGFLDYYLQRLGWSSPPNWLLSPGTALPTLIAFDVWRTLGYTFVLVLAGLQSIPQQLYEAATVDGANAWNRFWHVTIPMLSPTLLLVSVIGFIGAFQIFDPMYIMTQGGPGNATLSAVQELYQVAFQSFRIGYGSAVSVSVAAVILIVSALQLWISRYWVQYERI
jgi:multiple sugar transport system permease protein